MYSYNTPALQKRRFILHSDGFTPVYAEADFCQFIFVSKFTDID